MRTEISNLSLLATLLVPALVLAGQSKSRVLSGPTTPNGDLYEVFKGTTGMTAEEFARMGLDKLSEEELAAHLVWWYSTQENAKASVATFACHTHSGWLDAPQRKIKVFFEEPDRELPAEIISGIRERLRAMPDVEIIYSKSEADLSVSLVCLRNEMESGRFIGYSLSMVTSIPCETVAGKSSMPWSALQNHYLQIAAGAQQIIEYAVTTLDAKDLEPLREQQVTARRYVQEMNKKRENHKR